MNRKIKIGVLGVIILVVLGIVPVMAATPIYNPQPIGVQPPGGFYCPSLPPNWHPGMPIYVPMYCMVPAPPGLASQILGTVQNALRGHVIPLYWSPGTGLVGLRDGSVVEIPTISNPLSVFTNALGQLQYYRTSLINSLPTVGPIVQVHANLGGAIYIPANYVVKTYRP